MTNSLVLAHLPLADLLGRRCFRIPVEDAKQEAAVALVRAGQAFDPKRGVEFRLFAERVIVNHLINAAVIYAPLPAVETKTPAPSTAEQCESLRAALTKLMPDVRQALEMRYGEHEATFEEIGAALGCSHTYARAIVAAGLARLKRLME